MRGGQEGRTYPGEPSSHLGGDLRQRIGGPLEENHDLQRPGQGKHVRGNNIKAEGAEGRAEHKVVRRGSGGEVSAGNVDDAAVFAATQSHVLVADMHAGGNKRDGGTRGQLHLGGSGSGDRGGLRHGQGST